MSTSAEYRARKARNQRAWTKRNREQAQAIIDKWIAANPERRRAQLRARKVRTLARAKSDPVLAQKLRAQYTLLRAVRSGKMSRPGICSCCETSCTPQGHHADYAKPLAVVWLCARCHRRTHMIGAAK
jgi:hypothetical protein